MDFTSYLNQKLKAPEIRDEYEKISSEYAIISVLIKEKTSKFFCVQKSSENLS